MLFSEGKSGLVRLADGVKLGLSDCRAAAEEVLALHKAVFSGGAPTTVDEVLKVSVEDATRGVRLQALLHTRSLMTILGSCICIESYINSLCYFLYQERDLLGLFSSGRDTTAELLFESIDRLSTAEKWKTVARANGGNGFDVSRAPFQNLKPLFQFRNDVVHNKVGEYGGGARRYAGKLPDAVLGRLTLEHALFAAETYWLLVQEIHGLIGIPASEFQRHYNLAPWLDDNHRKSIKDLAEAYRRVLPT